MKKKALLEFLTKVENKAIHSVKEKFGAIIDEDKANVLNETGYHERLKKIQHRFNSVYEEYEKLVLEMQENKDTSYTLGTYNSFESEVSKFTGKEIEEKVANRCTFDGGIVQTIRNNMEKELEAVRANYLKVRAVCEGLPNGTKVAEYLTETGFDLSSLEKLEVKMLIPTIDKSKLFVCGENK